MRKLDQVADGEYLLIDLEDEQRDYRGLKHPFEGVPLKRDSLPPFEEDYLAYAAIMQGIWPWDYGTHWEACPAGISVPPARNWNDCSIAVFPMQDRQREYHQAYAMRFSLLSVAPEIG